ncbi:MAG: hypothetical protein ACOYL6_01640 [Bacteriovoracaceae bacterium]
MKKIIFILPFLFSINQSIACEEVNLFESKPRVMETKIVNQGDMNTCYAHTLAALYSMEKATNLSESLHTDWVAFNHKQRFIHWNPRNLNYSLLSWSYSDIKKNGVCSYQAVEEQLSLVKQGVPYSNDQLMFLLHTFFVKKRLYLVTLNSAFKKVLDHTYDSVMKKSKQFEVPWKKEDIEKILRPIKNHVATKSFFEYLGDDIFSVCRNMSHQIDDKLVSIGRAFESNNDVKARIEMALSEDKVVAIGYCSRKVVKDPTTEDMSSFPRVTRSMSTKCGAHYSLLVGSRKSAESCQLLLRNSYGQGYWGHPGMEYYCQDKVTGVRRNCSKEENNPNMKVLGGWVESKKISANAYEVSYFE